LIPIGDALLRSIECQHAQLRMLIPMLVCVSWRAHISMRILARRL